MLAFGYNAVVCHTKTLQVRGCFRHLNLGLACVEMKSGLNAFIIFKTWFPLNVSVIATNRSCLLARTLLRFGGFHWQPLLDLL